MPGYRYTGRSGRTCRYSRTISTTRTATYNIITRRYHCPLVSRYRNTGRTGTTCRYSRTLTTTRTASSRTTYTCPSVPGYRNISRSGRTCRYSRTLTTTRTASSRTIYTCPSVPGYNNNRRSGRTCYYSRTLTTTRTGSSRTIYTCPSVPRYRNTGRTGSTCRYSQTLTTTRSASSRTVYTCPSVTGYRYIGRTGATCRYSKTQTTTRTAQSSTSYTCPSAPDTFSFSSQSSTTCLYTRSGTTTLKASVTTPYTCPGSPATFSFSHASANPKGGPTCHYSRSTATTLLATRPTTTTTTSPPSTTTTTTTVPSTTSPTTTTVPTTTTTVATTSPTNPGSSAALAVPTITKANGYSPGQSTVGTITVEWDAVPGATMYRLKYIDYYIPYPPANLEAAMSRVSTSNLSAVLTDLKKNVLYRIQIQAVNGLRTSEWSEYALAYTVNLLVIPGSEIEGVPIVHFRRKTNNTVKFSYTFCTDDIVFERATAIEQIDQAVRRWENKIGFLETEEIKRTDDCSDAEKKLPNESSSIQLIRMATLREIRKHCGGNEDVYGCALHYPVVEPITRSNPIQKTQVWIRKALDNDSTCSKLMWTTVHEIGHVFGLGDILVYKPSVMSYDISNGYKCYPTLGDISAIVALYQNR